MSPNDEPETYIMIESWAGTRTIPVEMIEDGRNVAYIKVLEDCLLPGGRQAKAGQVHRVPAWAIRRKHANR